MAAFARLGVPQPSPPPPPPKKKRTRRKRKGKGLYESNHYPPLIHGIFDSTYPKELTDQFGFRRGSGIVLE